MSTASRTDTTSFGERLAQWRKERRLERQGRTVASRQMRGGALFARYVLLIVVAIVLVGPLILPLMAAFKAPGESELRPGTWTRLMVAVMRLAGGPDLGILPGSGP